MKVRETVWRGDRGGGTIFFRLDRDGKRVSPNLYVAYRAEGKEHVVSTLTTDLGQAKKLLDEYLFNRKAARKGIEILRTPKTERVTVADLLDANLSRAKEAKLKGLSGYGYRSETLRHLLGGIRAVEFRPEHVDSYKALRRKGEGTARRRKVGETAIRRELEILNRAFRYAVERRVLGYAPFIEKPIEDNVRTQEIPLDAFPAILAAIECPDTRDFCEWLLLTAMRPKGVRALRWEWFDRATWTLSVPREKNGKARVFSIEGSLRRVIERRLAVRRLDCPLIFHHGGQALSEKRDRRLFYAALEACGFEPGRSGFTLYDVKKTAAGLLVDSGLTEREAMAFSGHATPSMFDRYIIKSAERHGQSVRKRDAYLERRLAEKPAPAGFADNHSADADRVAVFPKVSGE
jgi:integrase